MDNRNLYDGYGKLTKACYTETMLTAIKIIQFLHGTCCIIGHHTPCRKENLYGREYNKDQGVFHPNEDRISGFS